MPRYVALIFGIIIVGLGLLALAVPETFMDTVRFFQVGQRVYIAAAIRVVVGIVIIQAAPDSRLPRVLRFVGGVIVALGLLTPISNHPLPSVVLSWWSPEFIRPWAITSIILGVFIIGAVVPPRELED